MGECDHCDFLYCDAFAAAVYRFGRIVCVDPFARRGHDPAGRICQTGTDRDLCHFFISCPQISSDDAKMAGSVSKADDLLSVVDNRDLTAEGYRDRCDHYDDLFCLSDYSYLSRRSPFSKGHR